MGHLHLIIKGTRRDALVAANQHSIVLFSCIPSRRNHPETHAMCDDEYRPQITAWFSEPPLDAPFPVGTLLHWSEQTRV